MLSKLLNTRLRQQLLLLTRIRVQHVVPVRRAGDLIPPTQYDIPIPMKLKPFQAMRVYWETIPLFVVTGISMAILFLSIAWATRNKVDVVFTSRSRENISRTMDLRNPSCHKMLTINQRYDPWEEMQAILDKMKVAQRRAEMRATPCYPK